MQIIGIYQKNINKTSEILQLSSVKGDEIKKRSHLRCAFLYRLDASTRIKKMFIVLAVINNLYSRHN